MKYRRQRGFTLIEVAVVIAVVAILVAIVVISFNTVQVQSRDQKRESDMRSLITLLEAYYDERGTYPTDGYLQTASQTGQVFYGQITTSDDVISSSTTVAQLRTMLGQGLSDSFGDPRRPSPNALFRHVPNAVDANSPRYFYNGGAVSIYSSGTLTLNMSMSFTGKSGGTFTCSVRFVDSPAKEMSYLLGYYVETTDNWIYYHGRRGGKLSFNVSGDATCASRVTIKDA